MLSIVDADKNGKLEFDEFLCMIKAGEKGSKTQFGAHNNKLLGPVQTLNKFFSNVVRGKMMKDS